MDTTAIHVTTQRIAFAYTLQQHTGVCSEGDGKPGERTAEAVAVLHDVPPRRQPRVR